MTVHKSSLAAVTEGMDTAIPSSPTADSPYDILNDLDDKLYGTVVTKTLTCDGNGAQTDNIFTLTGSVEIQAIWGVCTEATNSTDLADCSFALHDATATLELTDSGAPTDCSGMAVGDVIFKNGASATVAVAYNDIATGQLTDVTQTKVIISKKTGATTTIQFLFNGDNSTDVDIKFYVRYTPISDDGALAAA